MEEMRGEAAELLRGGYVSLEELWLVFAAHGGTISKADLGEFVLGLTPMGEADAQSLRLTLSKIRNE